VLIADRQWVVATYDALVRHGIDVSGWWDRQVALCLLGGLVQFGWEKAFGDDTEFNWWCDHARNATYLLRHPPSAGEPSRTDGIIRRASARAPIRSLRDLLLVNPESSDANSPRPRGRSRAERRRRESNPDTRLCRTLPRSTSS
jgi:hypothetical protein